MPLTPDAFNLSPHLLRVHVEYVQINWFQLFCMSVVTPPLPVDCSNIVSSFWFFLEKTESFRGLKQFSNRSFCLRSFLVNTFNANAKPYGDVTSIKTTQCLPP